MNNLLLVEIITWEAVLFCICDGQGLTAMTNAKGRQLTSKSVW